MIYPTLLFWANNYFMNYFFGINTLDFTSEIQIPTFQNRGLKFKNISLYKAFAKDGTWNIEKLNRNQVSDNFFIISGEEVTNKDIYFIAYENDLKNFDSKKLSNFNNFTDTAPSYRSNLKIHFKNGGFSSYQSEYPYSMIAKKGTILSPISSLANKKAERNFIFFKNIYEKPIYEKFEVYLVDIKNKKIVETIEFRTNTSNFFELNKFLINSNIFLVSKDYLGIPMYVSIDKGHVSFEHTHPPHEYILSHNKFKKVSELKKEINEIIN